MPLFQRGCAVEVMEAIEPVYIVTLDFNFLAPSTRHLLWEQSERGMNSACLAFFTFCHISQSKTYRYSPTFEGIYECLSREDDPLSLHSGEPPIATKPLGDDSDGC
jgi:hypothetical protein